MKSWKLIWVVLFASLSAWAQLTPPAPQPVIGARMPSLSPDGKRIAFTYRGDVWVANASGGNATPLTQHLEQDDHPVFSPDGKWIAFASKRNGNFDIFVVPAEGGETQQLTWHSGNEIPTGWSPDGKFLLFSSKRDAANFELFALDVKTLRCEKLCEDYAAINSANYSPDGKQVIYGRYGFPWTRPRYVGSAAEEIWLINLATGNRHALTWDDHQHLWPCFLPDGKRIVSVTIGEPTPSSTKLGETPTKFEDNPKRTPNLWAVDFQGEARQLTSFTGGGVRCPAVAAKSGDLAFEYGADLWLLKSGSKKPVKMEFFAARDEKQNERRRDTLNSGVTEFELSPDGKTIAFGLRGDIWTVQIEKPKGVAERNAELARRLTDWAGDDSDFSWSKDGKKMYFTSDREFSTGIYELNLETLAVKTLWHRNDDATRLTPSPDGKKLAFWISGADGGLYVLTLDSREAKQIVSIPGPQWYGAGGGDISWSPDNRWLAYTRTGEDRAWNIWVVPATGGDAVNLTRLNASHSQPAWSPDGKYLFFQSDRSGEGLYVLPLTRETARIDDVDLKFEKPKDPVEIKIDFDDVSRRIRKVNAQNPTSGLTVASGGQILFSSRGDIYSLTYDGRQSKKLTTSGNIFGLRVTSDEKRVYFSRNGELWFLRLDGNNSEQRVSFTAEWEHDVRAERLAAFTQFWRSYNRGFYDANFHGRDWEGIRRRYKPLLDAVETRDEFATLLNMMVGELEASHSEVSPAGSDTRSPVTPHLGFTFDYSHHGPGVRVAKVPPGTPGSYSATEIKPGDYVLAINGRDVTLDEHLYQWINDKQDREFEFLVNDHAAKDGARKVKYKVLTQREWDDLNYRNRIDRLRGYTEQKSRGKVGYLHISAMGQSDQLQFEREAYEYILGKDAMIIDVRFNRGGNISDTLIDWLDRKPHGYYRPRDGKPTTAPYRAWDKPIIVLMNEHSYSNGEMFPYAVRARGLGKLVGMPTPGYVIWTNEMRLVDGTGARMPQSGVYRLDGTPEENVGEKPDVRVPMSPDDWVLGNDPQLDKAIEMLVH